MINSVVFYVVIDIAITDSHQEKKEFFIFNVR